MPTPAEYEDYIKEHCPRLYGKQVMLFMFNSTFRNAVLSGDEALVGELLCEEFGFVPVSEGFAACDEWERHLNQ